MSHPILDDPEFLDLPPDEQDKIVSVIRQSQTPLGKLKASTMQALGAAGKAIGTGWDIAANKTPAAIRERGRTLATTGDVDKANVAADAAFKNPETSPSFQTEDINSVQGAIDKSPVLSNAADLSDKILTGIVKNAPGMSPIVKKGVSAFSSQASPSRFIASLPASAEGVAEDFATNPGQIGAALATEGALKGLGGVPVKGLTLAERAQNMPIGQFLASSEGQAGKAATSAIAARDAAMKLLPNTKGTLEQNRNAAEAASRYLGKSKNYEDVANQLELAKGINAGERQKLYDVGTLSEERSQHDPILTMILEYEDSPMSKTPAGQRNLRNLREIHTADVEHLNAQNPEALNDPNFYQDQKAKYQKEADRLGAYGANPSETLKSEAYKKLAQGYQAKLGNVSEEINPINQEESGLIQAHEAARDLADVEAKKTDPSLIAEATQAIAPGEKIALARFARKSLADRVLGNPARRLTSKISGSMAESDKAQQLADLIESIKAKRNPEAPVEPPLMLPPPAPKQLVYDRMGNIKRGMYLPEGQSSGPVINAEGSSTINMGADRAYPQTGNLPAVQYSGLQPQQPSSIQLPEVPESVKQARLQELIKQFGVQQYGDNPRSLTSESAIPQSPAPIPQEGLIMGPKRRKLIELMLKRRAQNLG